MLWVQHAAQLWHYPTFLLIPLMIVACVECFFGYRAWRFLLGLNGGVLGFIAGVVLCCMLHAPMLVLFGGFAGFLAGIAVFMGLVPLGSFVFAFGTAASLILLAGRLGGISGHWMLGLAALAGLAAGVQAALGRRRVMMALTAVAGAQEMASAWRAYHLPAIPPPLPDAIAPSELAAFAVLAIAGLCTQYAMCRKIRVAEELTSGSPTSPEQDAADNTADEASMQRPVAGR